MALKDDIALLARVPVFEGLEEEHLRLLAFGAERRPLDDGQMLFAEGSPADCAYVVSRGSLTLSRLDRDGRPVVESEAGVGAMVTELAMIIPTERGLTATAHGPSEVLRVTRALFMRMIEEYPEVGRMTEDRLRKRFSDMTGQLSGLLGRL